MARFVLFTFLVLCMVYMIQATPRPDVETTTLSPIEHGKAALEALAAKTKQSFEEMANNTHLQSMVENGKKLLEQGVQQFRKTMEEFMPKTDSAAPSA